jgi:S-DNA-T family DNA segregation ATPase FtsK/SpoIIIE
LAYQRAGDKKAWLVGITGTGVPYGKLFHEYIVGKFHLDASNEGSPCRAELAGVFREGQGQGERQGQIKIAELETRLGALVQSRYFAGFLMEKGAKLKSVQITAMARATSFWVRCLAEFLAQVPSLFEAPEKTLSAVFRKPASIRAAYPYPDGQTLRVNGRYDALLFNPDGREAVLFEFKGFKSSDVTVELSQTLVYAWIIHESTGVVPSIRLIYLEDDSPLYYSARDVKKMLGNLPGLFDATRLVLENRLPLPRAADSALCDNCPYRASCDSDWGEGGEEGEQEQEQAAVQDEGRRRMEQLLEAFRARRLAVEGHGYVCGPSFIRLKVIPDMSKGVTVRKIANMSEDLKVALSLPSAPLIGAQSGYVSVDVPRDHRQTLHLADLLKSGKPDGGGAAFPLGLDIDGKVFWADLADPSMSSVLIGGTSGSGKSVLLRSIVVGLLLCAPPDGVSLTLIDPKRVSFTDMRTLRCLEEKDILPDAEAALEALATAADEMERRYLLMEKAGVPDISAYNGAGTHRMRRRVLIIDEYADMMVGSKTKEPMERFVQRICQKGRAAGVHLIMATQRPDAKVVTGVIKANLQLRVALKVTSQANSQIILGEGLGQAQHLLGHGDMLVGGGVPLQRLQAPLASVEMLGKEHW